jgi:Transposase IS66 family
VRDDRRAGDTTPPAVWFAYTPDHKGEHPQKHLSSFRGTLQADAYAGFDQVYTDGRIEEAANWLSQKWGQLQCELGVTAGRPDDALPLFRDFVEGHNFIGVLR